MELVTPKDYEFQTFKKLMMLIVTGVHDFSSCAPDNDYNKNKSKGRAILILSEELLSLFICNGI